MSQYAESLKSAEKSVVFIGDDFIFGMLGDPNSINISELEEFLKQSNPKVDLKITDSINVKAGKKTSQVKGITQLSINKVQFNKPELLKLING